MSADIERTTRGRFAAGQSGNPAGARARKPARLITTDDFHQMILEVASSPTQAPRHGKPGMMSLLEYNVSTLARGKAANRLASKDFIDLTWRAAYHFEQRERERQRRERGY